MWRLLVCLPLCLCMAPDYADSPGGDRPARSVESFRDDGAALPRDADMERLAREKPIGFLENCLRKYAREVKGYRVVLQKQELIKGRLEPTEVIDVKFHEKPHSVYFNWLEGARKAERALYVEGENDGKMLARPKGKLQRLAVGDVVARSLDDPDVRASGRYNLREFGMKKGTERTLAAWKAAEERDGLDVKYLGVKKVKEAGNRECYALRETCKKPDPDGVTERVIYIDIDNWLQVGSVLKGEDGKLIGAYYFRDIRLNAEFKPEEFQRDALAE
ncbi:MAG TPA: DUF1571 domain-containing protein [Gemmataceae bacterium]|nr:DUF1571 domain-containing protein [Gemmataceae bacterium]